MEHYLFGHEGESLACQYLENKGFALIAKNFRRRHGEIDLIMKEGNTLVFVEVKTRSGRSYGEPIEAIEWWKQDHIRYAAKMFLRSHHWENVPVRFDTVEILKKPGWETRFRHIRNAF